MHLRILSPNLPTLSVFSFCVIIPKKEHHSTHYCRSNANGSYSHLPYHTVSGLRYRHACEVLRPTYPDCTHLSTLYLRIQIVPSNPDCTYVSTLDLRIQIVPSNPNHTGVSRLHTCGPTLYLPIPIAPSNAIKHTYPDSAHTYRDCTNVWKLHIRSQIALPYPDGTNGSRLHICIHFAHKKSDCTYLSRLHTHTQLVHIYSGLHICIQVAQAHSDSAHKDERPRWVKP